MKIKVILFFILCSSLSNARVFNLAQEAVAPYLKATYGPSVIDQSHFADSSGTGVTIDKSIATNMSGEFGVVFTGPRMGLRLGFELFSPDRITEAVGSNAAGTQLFAFESSVSGVIPKADFEIDVKLTGTTRWGFFLGGGAGTVSYKNNYALTADGQSAFPGVADYNEEGTGSATLMEGGVHFEHLLSDTTTVTWELGYRVYNIAEFTYKADVTTIDGVAHTKGDPVLNSDGTNKSLDFTGVYLGMMFRFYLGK